MHTRPHIRRRPTLFLTRCCFDRLQANPDAVASATSLSAGGGSGSGSLTNDVAARKPLSAIVEESLGMGDDKGTLATFKAHASHIRNNGKSWYPACPLMRESTNGDGRKRNCNKRVVEVGLLAALPTVGASMGCNALACVGVASSGWLRLMELRELPNHGAEAQLAVHPEREDGGLLRRPVDDHVRRGRHHDRRQGRQHAG